MATFYAKGLTDISTTVEGHIYYNSRTYNDTSQIKLCRANEVRSQPIIDNPNEYHLTIARMEIPCSSIPIFTFVDNSYILTLSYTGGNFSYPVPFVQSNMSNPSDRSITSYGQFLDGINTAFSSAMAAMIALGGPTGPAPVISYDELTGLFSVTVGPAFTSGSATIYFNQSLQHFFPSFRYLFYGVNLPNNKDYQLYITGSTTRQYASSTSALNDIQSIILVSNSLPIISEDVNSNPALSSANAGSASLNAITDFLYPVQNGSLESCPSGVNHLQYQPSLYRLVEMNSNQSLFAIDVTVYWTDKAGTLHPLYLDPGESFSIKFLFIKKTIAVQSS